MKNWTTQAEQRLEEYLQERAAREGFHGDDAVELKDDLRSHIHEEAGQQPQGNHRPDATGNHARPPRRRLPSRRSPRNRVFRDRKRGGFKTILLKWTFGVVLAGWGAGFRDDLLVLRLGVFRSGADLLACGTGRLGAAAQWLAAEWRPRGVRADPRGRRGAVLLVTRSVLRAVVPAAHSSISHCAGVCRHGIAFADARWPRHSLHGGSARDAKRGSMDVSSFKTGWRMGAVGGHCWFLLVLEGPALWTRVNLTAALAGGEKSEAAISRLRSWHSERVLLKACYEGNRGTQMATDISGWILMGWQIPAQTLGMGTSAPFDSETVREVFFRVTGKPFNSLKPPRSHRGGPVMRRGADPLEEVDFDDHVGGDDVAVRVKHLDLAESRFDGHVDSVSRIGYGEWTMVFKNDVEHRQGGELPGETAARRPCFPTHLVGEWRAAGGGVQHGFQGEGRLQGDGGRAAARSGARQCGGAGHGDGAVFSGAAPTAR